MLIKRFGFNLMHAVVIAGIISAICGPREAAAQNNASGNSAIPCVVSASGLTVNPRDINKGLPGFVLSAEIRDRGRRPIVTEFAFIGSIPDETNLIQIQPINASHKLEKQSSVTCRVRYQESTNVFMISDSPCLKDNQILVVDNGILVRPYLAELTDGKLYVRATVSRVQLGAILLPPVLRRERIRIENKENGREATAFVSGRGPVDLLLAIEVGHSQHFRVELGAVGTDGAFLPDAGICEN